MDESEVLIQTLNNTIGRHMRAVQNYEIEIANLTAEVVRLQSQLQYLLPDDENE
jgi:hypothetical protein